MEKQDISTKIYIETYGCQMNVADSEIVVSILNESGYEKTDDIQSADVILVNTCSIRENAEQRVWGRLDVFRQIKKKNPRLTIGVIGCMAERLKEKLIEEEKAVDIVVGPDAYRELPRLLENAGTGQKAVNVILSREETYADISPVRLDKNHISAFVSIMRGCNNMCSYCIVPYVRGAERSRDPKSILKEIEDLQKQGYKEVTLIGQNVDSYNWKPDKSDKVSFSQLLEMVAQISDKLRVRFSTSHPKDMSDEVLYTMSKYKNICKHIHLPAQSGSTRVLERMKRGYSREWYLNRINAIKQIIPDCAVSTDIMTGFPGETEQDHADTINLMKEVNYDFAYMFKYSERPNTYAARHLKDDIQESIKTQRLTEIIDLQNELSEKSKKEDLGKTFEVLVEGFSKKSKDYLFGRTSQNKVVVFPRLNHTIGDYVDVEIIDCTSATLIGEPTSKKIN
ncbi:MAG: tRNA (N6-isopentenyl adenosine(37)-C2)-methylthiotransferase MiaB [Bacteroidetes bacterium GWC2_33_15]|nr:MAG: tRNA (N6-isopentenyl adenosine(37)-C2)-methylthiotransferase MiaB [Bacteroidetes bacterium GWA2_33_15]OFX51230.1 MAG: tRNA (N6-isopentenyl adenosine(37)-C2)-methylthiotransferase MiaB [Bacteroidetes bacterium GWC2_33_15]OFX66340.1 MAG: tRNA (N6-isopentenyl adenosine(37)-C2)-methylthiotransferase MiaB [Bacteroidetes bacterium GWB2_32_14]OFX70633.1 MAG: tRNA (N6-isopentenyl adenosine(37)-C2)-methylthiotransferase MiaB [Bacteroidetes bacterium GWD2_33_33]HAN18780.1 tRNA (N6-isopentenyl ade